MLDNEDDGDGCYIMAIIRTNSQSLADEIETVMEAVLGKAEKERELSRRVMRPRGAMRYHFYESRVFAGYSAVFVHKTHTTFCVSLEEIESLISGPTEQDEEPLPAGVLRWLTIVGSVEFCQAVIHFLTNDKASWVSRFIESLAPLKQGDILTISTDRDPPHIKKWSMVEIYTGSKLDA
jgi:hypothetical protein